MKNTTKLKLILQLYTVSLDMDEGDNLQLTLIHKRTGDGQAFTHKSYTELIRMAFVYMNKQIKNRGIFL